MSQIAPRLKQGQRWPRKGQILKDYIIVPKILIGKSCSPPPQYIECMTGRYATGRLDLSKSFPLGQKIYPRQPALLESEFFLVWSAELK